MKEAIESDPSIGELHEYGRSLLAAGKSEKALEIFKLNRQKHTDDKFTTLVGLARGYTALATKKKLLKIGNLH